MIFSYFILSFHTLIVWLAGFSLELDSACDSKFLLLCEVSACLVDTALLNSGLPWTCLVWNSQNIDLTRPSESRFAIVRTNAISWFLNISELSSNLRFPSVLDRTRTFAKTLQMEPWRSPRVRLGKSMEFWREMSGALFGPDVRICQGHLRYYPGMLYHLYQVADPMLCIEAGANAA